MASKMRDHQFKTNAEQLQIFCNMNGGEISTDWTCPQSRELRLGPFCVLKNDVGQTQVTNGCTGSQDIGKYFFRACVLHDFCYHNHAFQDGQKKVGCDNKFLKDMLEICAERALQEEGVSWQCQFLAKKIFFRAVKTRGNKSWMCSNEAVEYPKTIHEL